jgi:hypothetical protein
LGKNELALVHGGALREDARDHNFDVRR